MSEPLMLEQYVSTLVLLGMGVVTVIGFFILNKLLAPKRGNKYRIEGLSAFVAYECGEVPIGDARSRFNFQYYVFALVFVVFDVVSAYLLAWALSIRDNKNSIFTAISFMIILALGFGYWWRRNALRWM